MPTHSSPPTRAQKGAPPSEEKLWTWNWSPRTLQPAGDRRHTAGQGRAGNSMQTPRGRGRGQRAPRPQGLTWGGGLVDNAVPVPLGDHGVAHGQQGQELLDAGCCGLQTEPRSVAVRTPLIYFRVRLKGLFLDSNPGVPSCCPQNRGQEPRFQAPFRSHLLTIQPISCGSQPPTLGT